MELVVLHSWKVYKEHLCSLTNGKRPASAITPAVWRRLGRCSWQLFGVCRRSWQVAAPVNYPAAHPTKIVFCYGLIKFLSFLATFLSLIFVKLSLKYPYNFPVNTLLLFLFQS